MKKLSNLLINNVGKIPTHENDSINRNNHYTSAFLFATTFCLYVKVIILKTEVSMLMMLKNVFVTHLYLVVGIIKFKKVEKKSISSYLLNSKFLEFHYHFIKNHEKNFFLIFQFFFFN